MAEDKALSPVEKLAKKLKGGEKIDALLASGVRMDDIVAAYRANSQAEHKARVRELPAPPALDADAWRAHKEWHADPEPVYGESRGLADFYFPAKAALDADDQVEFARWKDLLFKAVGTFLDPK